MICIGIDPGKRGAVAVLTLHEVLALYDSPLDLAGDFNPLACAAVLEPWKGNAIAFIEDQRSIPHKTKTGRMVVPCSDIVLGESLGIWRGVTGALGIPTRLVTPATWQCEMMRGLPSMKAYRGIVLARSLYPDLAGRLHGPKGAELDGRADAVLIARWGLKQTMVHHAAAHRTAQ